MIVSFLSFCCFTFGQTPLDCKKLKEGKFQLTDESSGITIITRKDGIQREENAKMGVIVEDKIQWINDCTYRLIPYKIIKNESGIDLSIDLQLEIEIIDIQSDHYVQRTLLRLNNQSFFKEIFIVKD